MQQPETIQLTLQPTQSFDCISTFTTARQPPPTLHIPKSDHHPIPPVFYQSNQLEETLHLILPDPTHHPAFHLANYPPLSHRHHGSDPQGTFSHRQPMFGGWQDGFVVCEKRPQAFEGHETPVSGERLDRSQQAHRFYSCPRSSEGKIHNADQLLNYFHVD